MTERRTIDFPIHFVVPDHLVWPELRDGGSDVISGQRLSELSGGILNSWLQRTCYQLRQAGTHCTINHKADPNAVNFFSVRDYGRRQRRTDVFALVPRGDGHKPMLADFIVNQNGINSLRANENWIPHWPQPGILPRASERGARLKVVAFKGRGRNLDSRFHSQDFKEKLKDLGMDFVMDSIDTLTGPHHWNDYREVDAVLAIRNLTVYDARKKPASKLVNAWFADAPAILSPEPAFRELRKSSLDYWEACGIDDAVSALRCLKENPDLYLDMIKNGQERRTEFSNEAITEKWIDLLAGPVRKRFLAWRKMGRARRWVSVSGGIFLEPFAKKWDGLMLREGQRICEDVSI